MRFGQVDTAVGTRAKRQSTPPEGVALIPNRRRVTGVDLSTVHFGQIGQELLVGTACTRRSQQRKVISGHLPEIGEVSAKSLLENGSSTR